ncbi:MAG: hypothetical protein JXB62_09810 [Pirellulales bacterium]|nr:hypothetical protein [Pirellulales bacterium]
MPRRPMPLLAAAVLAGIGLLSCCPAASSGGAEPPETRLVITVAPPEAETAVLPLRLSMRVGSGRLEWPQTTGPALADARPSQRQPSPPLSSGPALLPPEPLQRPVAVLVEPSRAIGRQFPGERAARPANTVPEPHERGAVRDTLQGALRAQRQPTLNARGSHHAEANAAPQPLRTAGGQPPRTVAAPPALLPMQAEVQPARSEQLEQIARQADALVRHGFDLADLRAYFAARAEFVRALRLIAQGLDAEHRTDAHSRHLAEGLTAIKEAEDFMPDGSQLEADLDISAIVASHHTPVLKGMATGAMAPLVALKCYFTYAQEQLAAAADREVAGSMALHALGKLHAALGRSGRGRVAAAEAKAMVFYQAALLVYRGNHMAANDLGVLLARCGHDTAAEEFLKHSLSICQQSTGWRNLAAVYRNLGRAGLAQRAEQLATTAQRAEIARRQGQRMPARRDVRWVDPNTFSRAGAAANPSPSSSAASPPPANATRQPASTASTSASGRQTRTGDSGTRK